MPRAHHPCSTHGVSLAGKTNSWVRVSRRAASSPTSRGYSVDTREKGDMKTALSTGVPLAFDPASEKGKEGRATTRRSSFSGEPKCRRVPVLLSTELAGESRFLPEGGILSSSPSYPPVTKAATRLRESPCLTPLYRDWYGSLLPAQPFQQTPWVTWIRRER